MDPQLSSIGDQIERLTKEAQGKIVTIDGRDYSTVKLHNPRTPQDVPDVLTVSTLSALAAYVSGKQDGEYLKDRGPLFVHVEGPGKAVLHTGVFGEHHQRVAMVAAVATIASFPFDQFTDPETFNILVQARIVDDLDRSAVLGIVGNLSTEAVSTLEDDGVSQTARLRTGVVKVAERKVPNPVRLRPYRTFIEVLQPESPFILRLRGGGDGKPPSCALIEADGGAWRIAAVANVIAFLRSHLPADVPVYG